MRDLSSYVGLKEIQKKCCEESLEMLDEGRFSTTSPLLPRCLEAQHISGFHHQKLLKGTSMLEHVLVFQERESKIDMVG